MIDLVPASAEQTERMMQVFINLGRNNIPALISLFFFYIIVMKSFYGFGDML
jgi:ABC-type amino acid transport system permease subunit